ncbi:hypothetical protein Trydic_g1897 [Trypoxylus dichotomus]
MRPVLIYVTETKADTTKVKNMMRAAEIKTLRVIKGIVGRDDDFGRTTSTKCWKADGRNRKRMENRILGDFPVDFPRDSTRTGHLFPKRLNHIRKSRRDKTKS